MVNLTGPEKARIAKFTANMPADVAEAITELFRYTKPGCDEAACELMQAAHTGGPVSGKTIACFREYGLVRENGTIPGPVAQAIRKAVAESYLVMHGPEIQAPQPVWLDPVCA